MSSGTGCLPSSKPRRRFAEIVENIDRIMRYTAGMSADMFAGDDKTCDAVERCLGRISESAVKLGAAAERSAPEQPWPRIRAFGNVLRHGYDSIDSGRIWQIVEQDLPTLRRACLSVLGMFDTDDDPS